MRIIKKLILPDEVETEIPFKSLIDAVAEIESIGRSTLFPHATVP